MTIAGGRREKSSARKGEASGTERAAGSGRYRFQNHSMSFAVVNRSGPLPRSRYDAVVMSWSTTGQTSSCSANAGPPRSRARSVHAAAMFPPALSPAMIRGASPFPRRDRQQRVPAVLERSRERMLGGPAVVHGDQTAPRGRREQPADRVVRVEVADHPAAAVEPHDRAGGVLGLVAPRADLARGRGDREVLDGRDVRPGAHELGEHPGRGARVLGAQLVERRRPRGLDTGQERLRLRMKGHRSLSCRTCGRAESSHADLARRYPAISRSAPRDPGARTRPSPSVR